MLALLAVLAELAALAVLAVLASIPKLDAITKSRTDEAHVRLPFAAPPQWAWLAETRHESTGNFKGTT